MDAYRTHPLGDDSPMIFDLQKASILKRISAALLDLILLCILAVGLGSGVSSVIGYDRHYQVLSDTYAQYEAEYGVTFSISPEEYEALSPEEATAYDEAYAALVADEDAISAYNMVLSQSLVVVSLGILLAYLVLEFAVPLVLGNGQTVGKKVFSLALMRTDGVQLQPFALFVRTVLGKYTVETMIPVLIVMMIFWGTIGILGPAILFVLGVAQLVLVIANHHNALIHDLLACTVVVDFSSQMIFRTSEDLLAYKQRIHAEQAAKKKY